MNPVPAKYKELLVVALCSVVFVAVRLRRILYTEEENVSRKLHLKMWTIPLNYCKVLCVLSVTVRRLQSVA